MVSPAFLAAACPELDGSLDGQQSRKRERAPYTAKVRLPRKQRFAVQRKDGLITEM